MNYRYKKKVETPRREMGNCKMLHTLPSCCQTHAKINPLMLKCLVRSKQPPLWVRSEIQCLVSAARHMSFHWFTLLHHYSQFLPIIFNHVSQWNKQGRESASALSKLIHSSLPIALSQTSSTLMNFLPNACFTASIQLYFRRPQDLCPLAFALIDFHQALSFNLTICLNHLRTWGSTLSVTSSPSSV